MVTHNGPRDGGVTLINQSVPGKKCTHMRRRSSFYYQQHTDWSVYGEYTRADVIMFTAYKICSRGKDDIDYLLYCCTVTTPPKPSPSPRPEYS